MGFFKNISGQFDANEYQETTIGSEVTTIDNLHLYLGVGATQMSPFAYYRGGYTVFGLMGNVENLHASYMYLYNHRINKITIAYNWGTYIDGDYHSNPESLILPDGRILIVVSSNHNNKYLYNHLH